MTRILIVSDPHDTESAYIAGKLTEKKIPHAWLSTDRLVERGGDWKIGSSGIDSGWSEVGVTTVWYRNRPMYPTRKARNFRQKMSDRLWPSRVMRAEAARQFVQQERTLLQAGIYQEYRDCRWVNEPVADWQARPGMVQLRVLHDSGLPVPDTLVTPNAESLQGFCVAHGGEVIVKPHGIQFVVAHEHMFPFTTRILTSDIDMSHVVRGGAVLVQERLDIKYELRVIVLGERVYAFKLDYEGRVADIKDIRGVEGAVKESFYELDPDVADKCRQACRSLGLVYGAVDLARTRDGRLVAFEINPNGQALWLQFSTGFDLTTPFIQMLLDE